MLVQQIAMTRWWGVQFLLKKEAHELHQHFSSLCLLFHLKSRRWGGAAGGRGFRVHSSVQSGLLGVSCKAGRSGWGLGGLMEWHLNPRLDTHLRASQIVQDASVQGPGSSPQFSATRKNGWVNSGIQNRSECSFPITRISTPSPLWPQSQHGHIYKKYKISLTCQQCCLRYVSFCISSSGSFSALQKCKPEHMKFFREVDFISCEVRRVLIDYSKYFKCWESKGGINHFCVGDCDTN